MESVREYFKEMRIKQIEMFYIRYFCFEYDRKGLKVPKSVYNG